MNPAHTLSGFFGIFFLILITSCAHAQLNSPYCGFDTYMDEMKKNDPKFESKLKLQDQQISEWIKLNASKKINSAVKTIPVVVHVLYENSAENISDATILAQVKTFNEDFSRTNSDTTYIPSVWKSVATNSGIQFCLAQRDPNGNPTNGIDRVATTVQTFTSLNDIVNSSSGGADTWDQTKYLNLWVCDLGGSTLGVGLFPGSNFEGLFIHYTAFGSGSMVPSHEFGHCFNLYHIWGDDGGACGNQGDLINDTPDQGSESWSCGPYPVYDACTTSGDGIMWMNFMDYTSCGAMFTKDQVDRMTASVNLYYNDLLTSNACDPVTLSPEDAATINITSPAAMECQTAITPVVTLKNYGANPLVSVTFNYKIDNGSINTYNWAGNLASLASGTVTLPVIITTQGNHSITVYTSSPNGAADGNMANDQQVSSFKVITSGQALPVSEGFEGTTFPPAGWMRVNPDGSFTWQRTTGAAKTGSASAYMNNKSYTSNGAVDELYLPNLDLTSTPSPALTFELAYQLLSDPNGSTTWSDTLAVQISTDCGKTYTEVYRKAGTNLVTANTVFSTTAFFPAANEWRLETINLSSFSGSNNAIVKFRHTTDYENNLFIDDVSISGATGINSTSLAGNPIQLIPNPADASVKIIFNNKHTDGLYTFNLYDITGKLLLTKQPEQKTTNEGFELDLSSLSIGTYVAELFGQQGRTFKRLVISR